MSAWWRAILVLSLLGTAPQADNPEYGWWAPFAPGSWVKLRIDGEVEGHPYILEQTQTLIEVDADRVVVDRKGTMRIGGRDVPANKEKEEIRLNDENALKVLNEGDEQLLIRGAWMPCHRLEARDDRAGARVQFWIAKDVPGGVVKGEVRPEGLTAVTRITVLSWERK
jgi:hypothetical protein